MKCQRRILGIRWHDFVRNSEVSLRTGLAPVSDRITRCRNAIFGHVTRLPDNTPAHQAMLRQVELSVGRPADLTWKRPPGRPRARWTDRLRRDTNNVPIATLWRRTTATKIYQSAPITNDTSDWPLNRLCGFLSKQVNCEGKGKGKGKHSIAVRKKPYRYCCQVVSLFSTKLNFPNSKHFLILLLRCCDC